MKTNKKLTAEQKRRKELRMLLFKYNIILTGTSVEDKEYLRKLVLSRKARQRSWQRVEDWMHMEELLREPKTSYEGIFKQFARWQEGGE